MKMTFPRVHSRAVVVNDKIWIIGGMSSAGEPVKEVEIIDTKTMTWTTAPSLINPRISERKKRRKQRRRFE